MKQLIAALIFSLVCVGLAIAERPATTGGKTTTKGEFGNHCAYGLTMGKQVPTDCTINMAIGTAGKTYCFSSETAKTEFTKNTPQNIAKASTTYAQIAAGQQLRQKTGTIN